MGAGKMHSPSHPWALSADSIGKISTMWKSGQHSELWAWAEVLAAVTVVGAGLTWVRLGEHVFVQKVPERGGEQSQRL